MKYRHLKGYEYEMLDTVVVDTGIVGEPIVHAESIDYVYMSLWDTGRLFISKDYAWDGPSGPTVHTKTFMRGSLVHDALYQLMREGKLDRKYRKRADQLLREICLEDGMNKFRAWYVYQAVRIFGDKNSKPSKKPRGKIVTLVWKNKKLISF